MAQTALKKDPKQYKAAEGLTRLSPGVYRNAKGEITNYQGKAVNTGGGKQNAEQRAAKAANKQTAGMGQQARDLYGQMADYAQQFDPNTYVSNYNPQFNQSMDNAYNAIMNQFELRNQKAFDQQKADLDQEAANKGWSPGGELYQRRFHELMNTQNQARQEAQNMAMTGAQNVQAQQFGQAGATAMLPGQLFGQFTLPLQQQYEKERMALEQKYKMQQIKATPQGGGGGTDPWSQYLMANMASRYGGGQGTSSGQSAIGGFTQGLGTGIGAGISKWIGS